MKNHFGNDWRKIPIRGVLLGLLAGYAFGAAASAVAETGRSGLLAGAGAVADEKARLWHQMEQVYQHVVPAQTPFSRAVTTLLGEECDLPQPERQRAEAYRAEAEGLMAERGLRVNGYYITDRGGVERDGQYNGGQYNGYLELSWDLLRGGYLEYKDRAKAASLRAEMEALRGDLAARQRALRCARSQVHEQFAALRSQLLTLKLQFMEPVYRAERRAYFKGWSHLDELLVSESDLVRLRNELSRLHADPGLRRAALEPVPLNPPVLDVDMLVVAAAIDADRYRERLHDLERSLVSLGRNERDNRLRLFLRRGFNQGRGSDVSAGVWVSLPLSQLERDRQEELTPWLAGLGADRAVQHWERVTDARSAYLDLREQLDRVIQQHYRYTRAHERARRSMVEYQLTPEQADVSLAVARMRDLLDAAIEMAEAKEVLYRRVLEVFARAQVDLRMEALRPVPLPAVQDRRRPGGRLLYLWSESFNRQPNPVLLSFLEAKGVDRVALSGGARMDTGKVSTFIRQAEQRGIAVEVVEGAPRWALPEYHARAITAVRRAADATGAVHLDVEPHTLPEFKAQEERFLDGYVALLGKLRAELGPDVRLTVAVPMHWPLKTYRELSPYVDGVYLMAYGEPRIGHLLQRLRPALSILPHDRLRLVVRASDFEDEWQLEHTLEALRKHTAVRAFGVHELSGYMRISGDAS